MKNKKTEALAVKKDEHIIALAGNPNVGKSTVFNYITGLKQHTGNWTGKTVENAYGRYKHNGENYVLVDLPGTYSMLARSHDEAAAGEYIKEGNHETVVVVADATALERNLNLTFQILEITSNVVLCINLIDEARNKGIHINIDKMSEMLGIPVVATSAKTGEGIEKLLDAVSDTTCARQFGKSCDTAISEKNESAIEKHNKMARDIAEKCISFECDNPNLRDRKIDAVITSKRWGIPIMLLFLAIVLWITIVGANYPSKLLSDVFSELEKIIIKGFASLNTPWWIKGVFIDGMYRTLTWVVSVMLPPMAIFFPLFTLLEDVGFLPRIAFNLDNSFHRACAHGKQALTTCMGFGCNAVGVTGCKIIDSPRERIIAILTNNFVPCNGRFSAIILISSAFIRAGAMPFARSFISAFVVLATIILGVLMTLFMSKLLSMTVLKGMPSHFILELPPYRKPKIGDVVVRSILDRTLFVLGRAVMTAAPAGILIWLMANLNVGGVSILNHTADFLNPFANFFGFDGYILLSFILGIPANEIVVPLMIMSYSAQNVLSDAAGAEVIRTIFSDNGWTLLTSINVILFMLMHFPCATTLMTIKKETKSLKWTALAFIIPTLSGLFICFLTTNIAKLLSLF